jgi:hypothetical protein
MVTSTCSGWQTLGNTLTDQPIDAWVLTWVL